MEYCIICGKVDIVFVGPAGHPNYHWDESNYENIKACLGPFTTCPPPELNENVWDMIFVNEPDEEFLLTWDVYYE